MRAHHRMPAALHSNQDPVQWAMQRTIALRATPGASPLHPDRVAAQRSESALLQDTGGNWSHDA